MKIFLCKAKIGKAAPGGDSNNSGSSSNEETNSSVSGCDSRYDSNYNISSSSNSRSSSVIAHIFDTDMIQLIMQDVMGMTLPSSSTSGAGGLERMNSQDSDSKSEEGDYTKDERAGGREGDESKSSSSFHSTEIEMEKIGHGQGNEIERNSSTTRRREKEGIRGREAAEANNLNIELLKVRKDILVPQI